MDLNSTEINFPFVEEVLQAASDKSILIENISGSARAFFLAKLFQESKKSILLILDTQQIDETFVDLSAFLKNPIKEFPSSEIDLSVKLVNLDAIGKRDALLHHCTSSNEPTFCISTLKALLEKTVAPQTTTQQYLELSQNDLIDADSVVDLLLSLGYKQSSLACEKGDFSFRGGIIDVFPLSDSIPSRIEFWDDKIISIRTYNPTDQLSIEKTSKVCISSAHIDNSNTNLDHTLIDYLPKDTLIVFCNPTILEDHFAEISGILANLPNKFITLETLFTQIAHLKTFFLSNHLMDNLQITKNDTYLDIFHKKISLTRKPFPCIYPELTLSSEENPLISFLNKISEYSQNNVQLSLFGTSLKALNDASILIKNYPNISHIEKQEALSSSLFIPNINLAIVSLNEFSSTKILRRQRQRSYFSSTKEEVYVPIPGETVVHLHNGIGKFLGVEKKPNHLNVETDYLVLEYADKAKLYVPSDQAYLISKYVGTSEKDPDLHSLNSSKWKRARELTEKSLLIYANKLLEIEATRSSTPGFVYPPHGEYTLKFAESFPYEETPDQLKAIDQIYNDMMSPKIMDRLICGDAGFGKTEILMRAAIKAVCDGRKQVIVMVPTTILAHQHYETFMHRMHDLPINIKVLSRFSSTKATKELFEQIASGTVDIIIGTHKLTNKNLVFTNPGLLIIDEEQRFGVKVKDYLKQLYPTIDCLTISATPIPRTLYMSLSGARDLSVVTMPPLDRLPVSTFVSERSDETIQSAIRHEILRGGQAYVIHNRIESIYSLGEKIRNLLPEAKITVAHGQMTSDELSNAFENFKSRKTNVLLATSLIENGIDIPNANTIVIDHADKFGVSDLYQMKGRVGRWNKKAYCHFLVNNLNFLSSTAARRLAALNKNEYGGGMKIALHDLELRGAGNILGTDQSGHVGAIGFNLYCKLLKKAVSALKNKTKPLLFNDDVKIEFPFNSRIPESYIPSSSLRIEFYQKIGNAEDTESLNIIKDELIDRFGPCPEPIDWLFALAHLRLFAMSHNIAWIKGSKNSLFVQQFHSKQEQIQKTLPYSLSPTPEDLIHEVLTLIKKAFPLNDIKATS